MIALKNQRSPNVLFNQQHITHQASSFGATLRMNMKAGYRRHAIAITGAVTPHGTLVPDTAIALELVRTNL